MVVSILLMVMEEEVKEKMDGMEKVVEILEVKMVLWVVEMGVQELELVLPSWALVLFERVEVLIQIQEL